ncbi:SusD/RagB family nutrient-binding outer membrane lipoprotein [Cyclobacterium plantarum]|uniref:SusD/RagB family nutrient-binding outer membrane lipoprotein n=1 Tax=Cyclobacterium plantarum TaxID=2716263 RepID=A0ABX0H5K9_9BACT|nr:SusD/RagB family nutrient-binding outer membrane lipoprotein [Cyclobacterium plantarum]NHE57135.1 SusD/RagB family nutrient-binding outer membrane lipoprotein [Cyclobacterium plantarum]
MKRNIKIIALISTIAFGVFSCQEDLIDMNVNPNGANPETANPNLVLSTVLTEAGKTIVNLGYQDIAGVMQHTQKDGWSGGHNLYEWNRNNSWAGYYGILRNNQFVNERAVELDQELQQGVTLVMKSMMFGLITDLWGDAPYTQALRGAEGTPEATFPAFDTQENIYRGVIQDLETANQLLSKPLAEYNSTIEGADVYFNGDPSKWRKMANSLKLRYYMRVSEKLPDFAKEGIETLLANPEQYPIITDPEDDATMPFADNSSSTSWPNNTRFDANESNYRRIKMCQTLVEAMRSKNDPRLGVWANRVQIPLVVDENLPPGTDRIENNQRLLSPDVLEERNVDLEDISQNSDYVGIPPAIPGPQVYNLSPDANQAAFNPHVSWLNDIYREPNGPLLRARLISASEVNFILAEAALKGWSVGNTAENYYQAAIMASFATWGLSDQAAAYLQEEEVRFEGSLEQLMEQKWIASWTAAAESWFDYRRTGFPQLQAGPFAIRAALPVRFYYMIDERNLNPEETEAAMARLETTNFSEVDGENSAWSKPWVIQGTGKPW